MVAVDIVAGHRAADSVPRRELAPRGMDCLRLEEAVAGEHMRHPAVEQVKCIAAGKGRAAAAVGRGVAGAVVDPDNQAANSVGLQRRQRPIVQQVA